MTGTNFFFMTVNYINCSFSSSSLIVVVIIIIFFFFSSSSFLFSFSSFSSFSFFSSSSSSHYSPLWTLASSKIVLQHSWTFNLHLHFLMPMFFRSSSIDSSHLNLGFSYTSSAFWFKKSNLSARIQFLHSTEVFQPPHFSCFLSLSLCLVHHNVYKACYLACSPYTIIINKNVNHSSYSCFKDLEYISILL